MKLFPSMPVISVSGFATDFLILAICAFPAWMLAIKHSRWLVPYILLTWAAGPEVRRVNDWMTGGFQSITVVSLIPMAATLALLVPIFENPRRLSNRLRTAIVLILLAFGYGTIIGVLLNGYGAAFEGLGFLVPFLLVPYAARRPYVAEERDLWLRSLSTIAALVAGYGWYQFLQAPPWDMQWMMQSGMFSSQGLPIPESFRVFSTVNSSGPLGLFMSAALIVGTCNRRWRGPLGLVGSLVIGSCLLISQVRLGWVMFVIAVATFLVIRRGAGRWEALATVIGASVAVLFLAPMLPGAELVSARFATFNTLDEDSSVQGRIAQAANSLGAIASHPMGSGFGATGVGGKLVSSSGGNGGADNGYVDLAITLGPVTTIIFFCGLILVGKEIFFLKDALIVGTPAQKTASLGHIALALAMFVGYAAAMLICNMFVGIGGALFWVVVVSPLRTSPRNIAPERNREIADAEDESSSAISPLLQRARRIDSKVAEA